MEKQCWRTFVFVKKRTGRTFLTIMMITVMQLLFVLGGYSSGLSQNKMQMNFKKITYDKLFQEIRSQIGFVAMYNNGVVDLQTEVRADFGEIDLKDLLDKTLKVNGLSYRIEGKFIIVLKEEQKKDKKVLAYVKGVVKDKENQPLSGVAIRLKGTTVGTTTNVNGSYEIGIPKDSSVLIFSFLGMKTVEVKYVGRDTIDVVMSEDVQQVEEVVVTGYQAVKKRGMTGSTSSIKGSDLVVNGTQTLEQALQGKLPGMMVINQSGLTGTRQKVRVRGTSTLLGNPEPVWVVDGIIQEDPLPFNAAQLTDIGDDNMDMIKNFVGGAIAWLNPSDIDNIVVLKDASSTAIYGVKAANGVIVITTKKGERGRMSVNYSGNFSMSAKMSYKNMELMNSQQRVGVSREAYERGCIVELEDPIGYMALALAYKRREISYDEFNTQAKKLEAMNTDWFDILFRTPFSHSHNISISGGNEKSTYRASLGINRSENTAKGNGLEQYNGSFNVTSTLWNRVTLNAGLAGSVVKTTGFASVDPYTYASTTNRAIPCYNEDGSLYFYPKGENNYLYNIVHELNNSGNENTTSSVNSNLSVRWNIVGGLTLSSTLGYNHSSSLGESWYTEESNYITAIREYEFGAYGSEDIQYKNSPLPVGGLLNVVESRNDNYTWRNQLEYINNFGKHAVSVMLGQESRSNKYDGYTQKNYGYMPDRGKSFAQVPITIGEKGEKNKLVRTSPSITDRTANYLSFYGNMSYMFDERYAVNASIRVDASNRFGQDKSARYQPVWSVGVRWNVSREHWLENQDILNDVSIRASYGFQGNVAENVGPELIAKFVPVDELSGSDDLKLSIKSLPAPHLKWEKNKSLNLGIDFSLFKSKINGTFEYYYKRTVDMITERKVPYANGVSSMVINGGNMTNSGWDLSVSVVPVRTKDFVWSLGMNTSQVYNKLKSSLEPTGDWKEAVSGELNKEGYAMSSFWAFRFSGLNPENGAPEFDLSGSDSEAAWEDATRYMVYAGKLDPDFTAGLNTSFRYKTLTLTANFYLSTGNQKFLVSPFKEMNSRGRIPSEYLNMSTEMVKRWREPGDEAHTNIPSLPHPTTNLASYPFYQNWKSFYPYEAYPYSDVRVVDAWYLRCNNITLSYNIPQRLISRYAQDVSVSFTVSNPFQIVSKDFQGRDPEVASGNQPLSRNYSLSVNVSF
ncbi:MULTISPECIES: SusC/RagA family TonB-linked outer membrane protein [Butyricimonas]|uniref:SusC/RagA family TonB-linked outer membrane protein n=1 Tax=Butyricimonas TaxID=574697 RepID=UPI0007FB23E1|nr:MULTISPECIES: SusC/RagA family TonB-linked outer membrane protein [Butyricimonas]